MEAVRCPGLEAGQLLSIYDIVPRLKYMCFTVSLARAMVWCLMKHRDTVLLLLLFIHSFIY